MRKIVKKVVVLACLTSAISAAQQAMAEDNITVWVDGEMLNFDTQPIMESDRTLVPMRAIFEALGAEVTWDQETRTAVAVKDDISIEIAIDSTVMTRNDEEIVLDVPARLINDRTLVPVRAVSESFDAEVEWSGDTRQVIITSNAEEEPENQPDGMIEVDAQPYYQLSDADMQILKNRYDNIIRYEFEQFNMPSVVIDADETVIDGIIEKNDFARTLPFSVWNQTVTANILDIQAESETLYVIDDTQSDESIINGFLKVINDAGLDAHNFFDVSFEELYDGSDMMLITFDKTDTLLACKYICIVVRPNRTVRYFTAETDPLDDTRLFFCEVTTEARGMISFMGFEKEDFINEIEATLKQNIGIGKTETSI